MERINRGYKKCPIWLKEAYIKAVGNRCQMRECPEIKDLEIHRIIRGNKGGLYIPQNCMVLCNRHHKFFHAREFL